MKISLVLLSLFGSLAACHADAVRLQIKGPDGKPVPGAQVRVVNVYASPQNPQAIPPVELKSDAVGKVTFDSKSVGAKSELNPDRVFLLARVIAPDLAVALINLKAGNNNLTLRKGQSFGGTVFGPDEKPVVGVKVALSRLSTSGPYFTTGFLSGHQRLEATTDVQGRWRLDNVPVSGPVGFNVRDDRFKGEFFWLDVGHPAPPLYLERGATVKGRVLRPDGKPAAGITFYGGDSAKPLKTKADGTFQFGGLSDTFYLQVATDSLSRLPFLMPYKRVENLEPGEIRDIGDIQTLKGIHLRGQVVDALTNKPLRDVSVSTWGGNFNNNTQGDSQGRFDVLIPTSPTSASIYATGFLSKSLSRMPNATTPLRGGVINLGIVNLKPARKVEGTVKTADGKGIVVTINATRPNTNTAYGSSDAKGKFVLEGLDVGTYKVSVPGHKFKTPVKLVVGKGPIAALRLVLTNNARANTPQTVKGRVLCDGQPVAGAKIRFQFRAENQWYSGQVALSSPDGAYSISIPLPNAIPEITSVSRPGYNAQYEAPKVANGAWRADVTLQKLATLQGRVVDSAGNPVANAFVTPQKGTDPPALTDANGEFTLVDVPASGVTLFASDGPRWQAHKLDKAGDSLQIVLPEAVPVADKIALAERVVPGSPHDWEWGKQWQVRGEPHAENMVRARAHGGGYWNWKDLLHIEAERAPERFLAHEQENRERVPTNSQAEFEPLLMLARASSKSEAAHDQVKEWLSAQEKQRREISRATIGQLLELAEIAQKVEPAQGTMWSEYAAQLADQIPGVYVGEYEGEGGVPLGKLAARVSPRALDMLMEECNTETKLQYLSSAMSTYAERGDVNSARQTFAKMQNMAAQIEAANKTKPRRFTRQLQTARSSLNQAREQLARLLTPTDPATALRIVTPLPTYQRPTLLLAIARSAVKRREADVARKAATLITSESWISAEYGAQVAIIALEFDKPLAEGLFRAAFRRVNPKNKDSDHWGQLMGYRDNSERLSIAEYARARAPLWPGESRVLIEREWVTRLELAKKKTNDPYSNASNMRSLVSAMAEVDPQRALEMLPQIPNEYNYQAGARGDIALALLRDQ